VHDRFDAHTRMSREFALDLDRSGQIVWADERARQQVGLERGMSLLQCSTDPGKVERLLTAEGGPAIPWELSLRHGERVLTACLWVEREDGVLHLLGSLAPEDYASLTQQLQATISELALLQRQTQRQNQALERQNEELRRMARELEDSGRGVVALHAEVDEKVLALRRADEVRAKIVTNVSHEFRTPLNSILGLSKLLLDETDGPLTQAQRVQLGFVSRSAEALAGLVDDMLDLSRLEGGATSLKVHTFTVADLFASLRGMMRPLLTRPEVELVFEDSDVGELTTDDGKVAQVLRNYISNALKFTEKGSIRVSARQVDQDQIVFTVADTGVGIPAELQTRLFREFSQLDNPLQAKVKGTGLGLSIVRRLGELLGGTTSVSSTPGQGSRFYLSVPRVHPDQREYEALLTQKLDPERAPVLVVEDDRQTLFLYQRYLQGSGFQVLPARTTDEARRILDEVLPAAIVLDVMLDGESSWSFLQELKATERTREIPTLVVTVTHREETARALGADEFFPKPVDGEWLTRKLASMARGHSNQVTLLVIDDDEPTRYLLRKLLGEAGYLVIEAADGAEGLRVARQHRPDAILLDFIMPGLSAFDVLDGLKSQPETREVPVFIHTSKALEPGELDKLGREAKAILHKQSLSREVAIARIREALEKAGVHGSSGSRP
jgi:signal transduction histidine kinase/CheY-like chemotaxis protein